GAAAEVALERAPHLLLARRGVVLEQSHGREHHPRRAVTALEGVLLMESLLDGVQLPVRGETLDRGELRAVGLDAEHRARLDGLAVEQHRAGAARRGVTADVRAGQPQPLAKDVDEKLPRLEVEVMGSSVDA